MNQADAIARLKDQQCWPDSELPVSFAEALARLQRGEWELSTLGDNGPYRPWRELGANERRWIERRADRFRWWARPAKPPPESPPTKPRKCKPSEERAYNGYIAACESTGRELTDEEAYAYVREHAHGDTVKVPRRETWKRQLRAARKAHEASG